MKYEENSGKHVDEIVEGTPCIKHFAEIGQGCFSVMLSDGKESMGICDVRIRAAGFNGEISAGSLRQKTKNGTAYSRR